MRLALLNKLSWNFVAAADYCSILEKKPLNHSAFTAVHGSSDYVSGCAMVYYRRASSRMKPWLKEHKYTAYVTHEDLSQTAFLLFILIRRTQACLVMGFCCRFAASDENF